MESKTCGECRKFKNIRCGHCEKNHPACIAFEPKLTNGDVIRQMSNEKLAELFDNSCKVCSRSVTECDCECVKGILEWLNAPAEIQLYDAIQNVIKDGVKTAIDIHEAAYAPDINVATKESEGEDE